MFFIRKSDRSALIGILLADTFSKTTAIFAKVLTDAGWTPVSMYFLTLLIVCIFLVVHEVMEVESGQQRWIVDRNDILGIGLTTLMGGVLSPLLFFSGMQYATASEAILITSLLPLFIVVFAVWLLGEHFTRPMLTGGGFLVAGTAVLLWRDLAQSSLNWGVLLLIGSSVTSALTTTFHKKYVKHRRLDSVVLVRTVLSAGVVGAWMFLTEPSSFAMLLQPQNIWVLFGMSVIGFILPFFIYFRALEHVTTMEAGVMVAATPAVGVLMAAGFLGETVTVAQVCSLLLIIAGILVINVPLTKKRIMPSRPMELGPLRR